MYDTLIKQRNYILEHLNGFKPSVGLILGSGLGNLAQRVEDPVIVNYGDIPEFPVSTVSGHAGRFIFGSLSGCNVAVMQG
ncbi:MAG: purine-nucleoside phosphorylase, partial [Clostridiales bacterium]|nr:purine-nucleoside phosphorylase [Clostridiales bacterium]